MRKEENYQICCHLKGSQMALYASAQCRINTTFKILFQAISYLASIERVNLFFMNSSPIHDNEEPHKGLSYMFFRTQNVSLRKDSVATARSESCSLHQNGSQAGQQVICNKRIAALSGTCKWLKENKQLGMRIVTIIVVTATLSRVIKLLRNTH